MCTSILWGIDIYVKNSYTKALTLKCCWGDHLGWDWGPAAELWLLHQDCEGPWDAKTEEGRSLGGYWDVQPCHTDVTVMWLVALHFARARKRHVNSRGFLDCVLFGSFMCDITAYPHFLCWYFVEIMYYNPSIYVYTQYVQQKKAGAARSKWACHTGQKI